ncbi:MAG TPA: RpiB/LacA/LacB family sugar-phosphate isomerase [Longimicrobiales bacterium]|nr:RpiB/LacA/LacB family sugar-phosphate isomerase [Longimicrobiales bacterium]
MRIAVSADERVHLVDEILEDLEDRGHEVVYFGPEPGGEAVDWPDVTLEAVSRVTGHEADQAIVMCWTGTGCSIVANKMPGIRAALCHDAETARGARIWNHANVLALSLRATSGPVVKEILDRWFDTPLSEDEWNLRQMARVREIEEAGGEGG